MILTHQVLLGFHDGASATAAVVIPPLPPGVMSPLDWNEILKRTFIESSQALRTHAQGKASTQIGHADFEQVWKLVYDRSNNWLRTTPV